MKHIDLFSGIGGFAYAARTVWGRDYENVLFCDNNKFCQEVIRKNFGKGSVIVDDINYLRSWNIDKNVGKCYSKVCEHKNRKKLLYEMLPSLIRLTPNGELAVSVKIAENQCPFLSVILKKVAESIAQKNVGMNICAETTHLMPAADNGCAGKITQTGKMGWVNGAANSDKPDTKKQNKPGGEDVYLPGMDISAKNADIVKGKNSTPTILKVGQNIPPYVLKYLTELLYANLATKNFTCPKEKQTIDLLSAGTPCQPASQAGKRRGTADDRWLWPKTFQIIREFHPRWVILENVRGLLTLDNGVAFEDCCLELETSGYEVQSFIVPACAIGAPHRRDRYWIIANANDSRDRTQSDRNDRNGSEKNEGQKEQPQFGGRIQPDQRKGRELWRQGQRCGGDAEHTDSSRLQRMREELNGSGPAGLQYRENPEWGQNWFEIASQLCRVDDGLPVELDGLKLTAAKHREERLKGGGNAIVPQVAETFMTIIKAIDEGRI